VRAIDAEAECIGRASLVASGAGGTARDGSGGPVRVEVFPSSAWSPEAGEGGGSSVLKMLTGENLGGESMSGADGRKLLMKNLLIDADRWQAAIFMRFKTLGRVG